MGYWPGREREREKERGRGRGTHTHTHTHTQHPPEVGEDGEGHEDGGEGE